MDEREIALFLLEIPDMYSAKLRKLCDYAGSLTDALSIPGMELYRAGILKNEDQAHQYDRFIRNQLHTLKNDSKERLKRLNEKNISMCLYFEEEFPDRLNQVQNPPGVLFYKGELPDFNQKIAAIIGARRCSEYGNSVTGFFAQELSKNGVDILSGMAYGIDSSAARGAIKGHGRSYAILGCGVDICYPKESYDIYTKMSEGMGGIISEYVPGTEPLGFRFVERNRIIAGLCDVLLVMEAKEKSGTSITVADALDLGKDIFALPGRITDPLGRGCNNLLRDGAIPLTTPEDVLGYFGISKECRKEMAEKDLSCLTPLQKRVFDILGPDSRHIEDIANESGISVKNAISVLFELEMMGYVVSPTSAYYRKDYLSH